MNPVTPFTPTYIPINPRFPNLHDGSSTHAARALNTAWQTRDRLRLWLFLFGDLTWMPLIGPTIEKWRILDEEARAEIGVLSAYA